MTASLIWCRACRESVRSAGPYQVRHLCELIHIESAQALATYRDDFYAGRPAVTVNAFGKGKAWRMWPPATI